MEWGFYSRVQRLIYTSASEPNYLVSCILYKPVVQSKWMSSISTLSDSINAAMHSCSKRWVWIAPVRVLEAMWWAGDKEGCMTIDWPINVHCWFPIFFCIRSIMRGLMYKRSCDWASWNMHRHAIIVLLHHLRARCLFIHMVLYAIVERCV